MSLSHKGDSDTRLQPPVLPPQLCCDRRVTSGTESEHRATHFDGGCRHPEQPLHPCTQRPGRHELLWGSAPSLYQSSIPSDPGLSQNQPQDDKDNLKSFKVQVLSLHFNQRDVHDTAPTLTNKSTHTRRRGQSSRRRTAPAAARPCRLRPVSLTNPTSGDPALDSAPDGLNTRGLERPEVTPNRRYHSKNAHAFKILGSLNRQHAISEDVKLK